MHQAARDAYQLLSSRQYGILSSLSVKVRGYPLGSVTPYVLDGDGNPVILISDIAQHTANLKEDTRCSLTVVENTDGDVQAHGRICVMANAEPLSEHGVSAVAARYLRFYPDAETYFTAHDFSFWRLLPLKIRYIGGFGQIHWLDPDDTLKANPFSGPAETAACVHMNERHQEALRRYCDFSNIEYSGEQPLMVGLDSEALYLRVGLAVHRLAFRRNVLTNDRLREETLAMCRADYWRTRRAA
ncbi:pyridoxamine 5'-phosphate oxidase-like FMN-binding protein [Oceanococcus atlanticus]|uniref:Pyridoxamine 5'-phosphate oxidase-like FMN-binding protein n=1 Tax=Oceanococcus atlanticus TaxID=1317117 RepID=A0A1Y1SC08_9GAMM|nr:DUF2470 domain-containing protein [Oceanococcus atlanticus]ORE85865.1 pyridoxamine 5'-phosphate oxidase-like FMN-binding protein [Oceanococcus atlanticus]RZO86312.1 MAG: DUF2470 domain-containing protein [Oceanococcus sp.]